MEYDAILLRFGELFLKGKNRQRFIDRLYQTIRNKVSVFPNLTLALKRDHIIILLHNTDYQAVIEKLNYVFGIHSYALGNLCQSSIESIKKTVLPIAIKSCQNGKSIKFETKRSWKGFPLTSTATSQYVAQFVGETAPEGSILFNVKKPDLEVRILVKKEYTLIVSEIVIASGGLPIGLNGGALLMLSGGLDSPVAGYLTMKRGLHIDGIHFESPPHTSPRARQKVFDLAEKMAHFLPREKFRLHIIPFTTLQKEIFAHIPESYGMTVMRRMMYRISEGIALKHKMHLLTNGESIGQVASQTPASMAAINAVIELPVVRPVACMDKSEIVDVARKIDTFSISIRPFEDCCTIFVPPSPATAPKKAKCDLFESRFDWAPLVEECIKNSETIEIEAGKPITIDSDTTDEICSLL